MASISALPRTEICSRPSGDFEQILLGLAVLVVDFTKNFVRPYKS